MKNERYCSYSIGSVTRSRGLFGSFFLLKFLLPALGYDHAKSSTIYEGLGLERRRMRNAKNAQCAQLSDVSLFFIATEPLEKKSTKLRNNNCLLLVMRSRKRDKAFVKATGLVGPHQAITHSSIRSRPVKIRKKGT